MVAAWIGRCQQHERNSRLPAFSPTVQDGSRPVRVLVCRRVPEQLLAGTKVRPDEIELFGLHLPRR